MSTLEKLPTLNDGIEICKLLYLVLSPHGYYPALTGGMCYKSGERKDIDIVIYRNRQKINKFEMTDIFTHLEKIGIEISGHYGFVTKAKWNGFVIDLFNPETEQTSANY